MKPVLRPLDGVGCGVSPEQARGREQLLALWARRAAGWAFKSTETGVEGKSCQAVGRDSSHHTSTGQQ